MAAVGVLVACAVAGVAMGSSTPSPTQLTLRIPLQKRYTSWSVGATRYGIALNGTADVRAPAVFFFPALQPVLPPPFVHTRTDARDCAAHCLRLTR